MAEDARYRGHIRAARDHQTGGGVPERMDVQLLRQAVFLEDYKDKDGNKLTDFISVKVRGPLAERCAEFAWKGCKLAASGDFETITFEDEPERQPGFLIKASEVEFLSPRKVEEPAQEMEDETSCEVAA